MGRQAILVSGWTLATVILMTSFISCAQATALGRAAWFVFYIDSINGNDQNDGMSPSSPWRTISRLDSENLLPRTAILLKRNCTWREELAIRWSGMPGRPILFGAYGEGTPPLLLGSVDCSDPSNWTHLSGNLWGTPPGSFPADVGFVMFGEERPKNTGFKCLNLSMVSRDRDFYYDDRGLRLVVYCDENPAAKFNRIEAAFSESSYEHLIKIQGQHDVVIDGLELKYFNSHGIGMSRVKRITIRNCKITYGGGQIQYGTVRYGNGIEFWDSAEDCLVERNIVGQIYDAAVTNQGNDENRQKNITYRYNVLFDSEYLYEYWNRPEKSLTDDIRFANNILLGAGYGWAHSQRPDPSGHGLSFHQNTAAVKRFNVSDNIFINATMCCVYVSEVWNGVENLTLERNRYCQVAGGNIVAFMGKSYGAPKFRAYQQESGKDSGSEILDLHQARRLADAERKAYIGGGTNLYVLEKVQPPRSDLWIYRDGLHNGWRLTTTRATVDTASAETIPSGKCQKISFERFCSLQYIAPDPWEFNPWMYDSLRLRINLAGASIEDIVISKTGAGSSTSLSLIRDCDLTLSPDGWNDIIIPVKKLGWGFGSQLESLKITILGKGIIYVDDIRLTVAEKAGSTVMIALVIGLLMALATFRGLARASTRSPE